MNYDTCWALCWRLIINCSTNSNWKSHRRNLKKMDSNSNQAMKIEKCVKTSIETFQILSKNNLIFQQQNYSLQYRSYWELVKVYFQLSTLPKCQKSNQNHCNHRHCRFNNARYFDTQKIFMIKSLETIAIFHCTIFIIIFI